MSIDFSKIFGGQPNNPPVSYPPYNQSQNYSPTQNFPPQQQPAYQPQPVQQPNPVVENRPIYQEPIQQYPYQQPNYYPQPSQPVQNPPKQEYFSREAMAKWLLTEKNIQKTDAIVGLGAAIAPIIVSVFWGQVGLWVGGLLAAFFVYRLINSNKDINYLKQTYHL